MAASPRLRLDRLMVDKGLVPSRQRARALIMAGKIRVNDIPVDKAGTQVPPHSTIVITGQDLPFVSRGGLKLEKALTTLCLDVSGFTCLDIGASTGGFTDCLLQHGAARVYAVDVGYGQLAWTLRQDSRVVVIERTNIRYMSFDTIGETVDLVTIDTSFISLKLVIPAARKFMAPGTRMLALIKPQFEAGKHRLSKGGVVRDPAVRGQIVDEIADFCGQQGFETGRAIESPVPGPKGNIEFILPIQLESPGKPVDMDKNP